MKRNKAIAFVLSTALFALALTACGSQSSNGTPADDNSQSGGDASAKHKEMGCVCFENPAMGIYFISDPDGYWIEIVPVKD